MVSPFLSRFPVGQRSIFVATYPPQQCGIATFTHDLLKAVHTRCADQCAAVAAISESCDDFDFPPEVVERCERDDVTSYLRLANVINRSHYDTVCVQHEFGIFGGSEGGHVVELLKALRKPSVTTLHTVLANPSEAYRRRLRQVADASDAVAVLTPRAIRLLADVYGVQPTKVRLIPHGIADVPFVEPEPFARRIGAEGRMIIMTFGLIGPSKGIEDMIRAMPAVVERHPEALYVIVGATHPGIVSRDGERYRRTLEEMVAALDLKQHVVFRNTYMSDAELRDYMAACTIYVTPYPNREQISSGTLAQAVGAGKAVVSTPYWYAQDLLADGRGMLVDFRSPPSLARAINELIEGKDRREDMRRRAYEFGRHMLWSNVADGYLQLCSEVAASHMLGPAAANFDHGTAPGGGMSVSMFGSRMWP